MTKHLYIKTYGCQMNVYDSERMASLLKPLGYSLTDNPTQADISILNTCHIREKAEQKVYSDLGRLRDQKDLRRLEGQDMLIAVGGCVAQAEGEEILRQAPYVSMVFGPQTYHRLPEMIAQIHRRQALEEEQKSSTQKSSKRAKRGIVDTDFPVESKFDHLPHVEASSSSCFLSIQEGCDKFCTFCVVPYTRGMEFSRPVADILVEAKRLVESGAKEITLLGQNVNAYHGKAPVLTSLDQGQEWGLGRLLYALADISGLQRIRYTTSHPRDMSQELIKAHGEIPQLMPFLHLPVQSGSDKILKQMNRKHTAEDYLKVIDQLRQARPDIAFSSDFIIGFPGETKADHQQTLSLIEAVGFAQAYSFQYSIRPGTPAGAMELQVEDAVKKERLYEIQDLLKQQQLTFNQSKLGTLQPVLFDRTGKIAGQILGKTPYMQSVPSEGSERLVGQLVTVEIQAAYAHSLSGVIIDEEPLSYSAAAA